MRRPSRSAILVGVEAGEMLADDLRFRIALGPLGTGVPVGHDPFEVEHEDGVIRDALDEMAKASLPEIAVVSIADRWNGLAVVVARVPRPISRVVGDPLLHRTTSCPCLGLKGGSISNGTSLLMFLFYPRSTDPQA